MSQDIRTVNVVIGVIYKEGKILIQQRSKNNAYFGGLWELPGGKIESNETKEEALKRELEEELDIIVEDIDFWKDQTHYYKEKNFIVNLYYFHVRKFSKDPTPKEGQTLMWLSAKDELNFTKMKFLEADMETIQQLHQNLLNQSL